MSINPPIIRQIGLVDYESTWRAMREFTAQRHENTPDEIWLLQHPPVYTLGQAGKPEHLLRESGIPVIKIDRGGQITYHGPGQLIVYLMIDLKRYHLKIRTLVVLIEQAIIECLTDFNLDPSRREGAPGVYIDNKKIAALGLRIKNGCSYHGLSLNIDMDLRPFDDINPCGYPGLKTTQLRDLGITAGMDAIAERLLAHLLRLLASV